MKTPSLIAHWPLCGDTRDRAGDHHGQPSRIEYTKGPRGDPNGAALFRQQCSAIMVPDHKLLRLGNRDFTIAMWIRCEDRMRVIFGDLLSKYDPAARCGVNLYEDIGTDWNHVVALRKGKKLALYLNGQPVAEPLSRPRVCLDLANTTPLLIGRGAQASFTGAISDVRLYSRALDEKTIRELAGRRK